MKYQFKLLSCGDMAVSGKMVKCDKCGETVEICGVCYDIIERGQIYEKLFQEGRVRINRAAYVYHKDCGGRLRLLTTYA